MKEKTAEEVIKAMTKSGSFDYVCSGAIIKCIYNLFASFKEGSFRVFYRVTTFNCNLIKAVDVLVASLLLFFIGYFCLLYAAFDSNHYTTTCTIRQFVGKLPTSKAMIYSLVFYVSTYIKVT